MQATNPSLQVTEAASTYSSSKRIIKSFTDLAGATIDDELDQIALAMRQSVEGWRTAGKLLVEMSRRQPDVFRMMQARHPQISTSLLQTMAAIGRNEIWPWLLLDSSIGARALLLCSYDLQKKYSEEPTEVVIAWDGQKMKTVKKKISELNRAEVARIFPGDGTMNDLDKQAWRLKTPSDRLQTLAKSGISPAVLAIKAEPYSPPRLVNVEMGYFEIALQQDGKLQCKPCDKFSNAQPVRLMSIGKEWTTKIFLYKQTSK